MFEITRCDSRTAIDTCKEAGLPAEHGRPLLEVRRCGDGHPPVTERERDIRLNGTGGVKFCVARIEKSVRAFSLSGSKSRTLKRSTSNAAIGASFFIERWTLCVNRWTFSFDESA